MNNEEFIYFLHPEYNKEAMMSLAEDLIKRLDGNHDQALSEEEFLAYYSKKMGHVYTKNEDKQKELLERWRRTFHRAIDANGDGTADVKEFADFLDPSNEYHATDEASYLISQADRDGDGRLTLQEVLKHSDLFAGSSMTDSSFKLHWDEL